MRTVQPHFLSPGLWTSMILLLVSSAFSGDLESSSDPQLTSSESSFSDKWYVDLRGLKGISVRSFDRVNGFAPLFRIAVREVEEGSYPSLDLTALYYLERGKVGWSASIENTFLKPIHFLTRFEFFRETDTRDRWRMSDVENSIAAFLFREDFRDYHERYGVRFSIEKEIGFFHKISAGYVDQEVSSVSANRPFTVFGWEKEFRGNPAVDEGEEHTLWLEWVYDSRDNIRFPRKGWHNSLSLETSPGGLGGDFSFHLLTAELRRYYMVFGGHSMSFRLLMAFSGESPPPHKWFTIGGVGTLRGYPDLSETGSNLLLGNFEYRFPLRKLGWKPLSVVFNEIQGMCFLDAGDSWSEEWNLSGVRADAGIGVSGANIFSYFGLYVAQALERNWRDPRVTIRLKRDF